MNGFGTIAAVVAGFKAGEISEQAARRMLRELGCDDDITNILGIGAGIVGGLVLGNVIGDAVSDIFEDLF